MMMPPGRQPVSQISGVRIDLATACLIQRERDEAEEALSHVFAIPALLRNVSLSGRLARTREILANPCWTGDPAVRHLDDALEEWLARRP